MPQRLLSFREAVQVALQAERDHTVAARWTEGAMMFRNYRQDNAYYAKQAGGSAVGQATRRHCGVSSPPSAATRAMAPWAGCGGCGAPSTGCSAGPACRAAGVMRRTCGPGDRIDYWTVLALEPEHRLTLHFGMKAPGSGVLEFVIDPVPQGQHSGSASPPTGIRRACGACSTGTR